MTPTGQRATPTKSLFMRLIVLCLTFAFLTQSLAVQTHIHGGPLSGVASITHLSNPTPPNQSDPYDPASCPLCQEMMHAGSFVIPAIISVIISLTANPFLPVFAVLPHSSAARQYNWQSRAPPRH